MIVSEKEPHETQITINYIDTISGIDPATVNVKINEQPVSGAATENSFTTQQPLNYGTYNVDVTVSDIAGNTTAYYFSFDIAPVVDIKATKVVTEVWNESTQTVEWPSPSEQPAPSKRYSQIFAPNLVSAGASGTRMNWPGYGLSYSNVKCQA